MHDVHIHGYIQLFFETEKNSNNFQTCRESSSDLELKIHLYKQTFISRKLTIPAEVKKLIYLNL